MGEMSSEEVFRLAQRACAEHISNVDTIARISTQIANQRPHIQIMAENLISDGTFVSRMAEEITRTVTPVIDGMLEAHKRECESTELLMNHLTGHDVAHVNLVRKVDQHIADEEKDNSLRKKLFTTGMSVLVFLIKTVAVLAVMLICGVSFRDVITGWVQKNFMPPAIKKGVPSGKSGSQQHIP